MKIKANNPNKLTVFFYQMVECFVFASMAHYPMTVTHYNIYKLHQKKKGQLPDLKFYKLTKVKCWVILYNRYNKWYNLDNNAETKISNSNYGILKISSVNMQVKRRSLKFRIIFILFSLQLLLFNLVFKFSLNTISFLFHDFWTTF